MKLTVNKKQAELLKDVQTKEDDNKILLSLTQDNIKSIQIGFIGEDIESNTNITIKNILLSYNEKGEIIIGYSNRYGNGHRCFPIKALETLLWEDKGRSTHNVNALRENRESYTL